RQSPRFLGVWDWIFELERRRIGTGRVLESEDAVILDFIEQRKGFLELCLRLAGEADDDVSCDADFPLRSFHPSDALEVLLASVKALHGIEHASRAGLDLQVNVVAERWN